MQCANAIDLKLNLVFTVTLGRRSGVADSAVVVESNGLLSANSRVL